MLWFRGTVTYIDDQYNDIDFFKIIFYRRTFRHEIRSSWTLHQFCGRN